MYASLVMKENKENRVEYPLVTEYYFSGQVKSL